MAVLQKDFQIFKTTMHYNL